MALPSTPNLTSEMKALQKKVTLLSLVNQHKRSYLSTPEERLDDENSSGWLRICRLI